MPGFDSTSIAGIDANSISRRNPSNGQPRRTMQPMFNNLADATKHLEGLLKTIPVGQRIVVNGTTMTRQPLPGTPQTVLKAGFGTGRYNTLITAADLYDGTFMITRP